MRIADLGARGGFERHWDIYGSGVELIGFEPDAAECERLNQAQSVKSSAARRESYYPVALHRERGVKTLHITQNPQASSFLTPNWEFVNRFPQSGLATVVGTEQIQTTDMDSFMAENRIDYIDFMKIDVEGAELAVFEGAKKLLSESLLGASVEVFFQPYHIGRPLFGDIDRYLRRFGFVLFDLHPERWRRKTMATTDPKTWYEGGQMIWAQALYLRDFTAEMLCGSQPKVENAAIKVLKAASLAELFGFQDFAIEMLSSARRVGLLNKEDLGSMVGLLSSSDPERLHLAALEEIRQTAKVLSSQGKRLLRCGEYEEARKCFRLAFFYRPLYWRNLRRLMLAHVPGARELYALQKRRKETQQSRFLGDRNNGAK